MSRKIAIALTTTLAVTMLMSAAASAHESDVHHWFEHQRALTDGGPVGIIEPAPEDAATQPVQSGALPARVLASAQDRFAEQLGMTDGAVTAQQARAR